MSGRNGVFEAAGQCVLRVGFRKLQHANLVQLYGVCSKNRPIFIVTEYMRHGSLLNYLRRHEQSLASNQGLLLDMCIQVCSGLFQVS